MIMSKLGEKESPATYFIFQRPQFKHGHRFFDLLIWKNWNLIIITIISHGISCKKSLKRHGIPFYKICIILIPCSHFFQIPSLLFLYFFTLWNFLSLSPLISSPPCLLCLSSPLSISLFPAVYLSLLSLSLFSPLFDVCFTLASKLLFFLARASISFWSLFLLCYLSLSLSPLLSLPLFLSISILFFFLSCSTAPFSLSLPLYPSLLSSPLFLYSVVFPS